MKNEQILKLFTQIFGSSRLEGGELSGYADNDAKIVVSDEDGTIFFEVTTAQVSWALEGAGFEVAVAPASRQA